MHRDIHHKAHVEVVGFIFCAYGVDFAKFSLVVIIRFGRVYFVYSFSHFRTKCFSFVFDSNLLDLIVFLLQNTLKCFTYAKFVWFNQLDYLITNTGVFCFNLCYHGDVPDMISTDWCMRNSSWQI